MEVYILIIILFIYVLFQEQIVQDINIITVRAYVQFYIISLKEPEVFDVLY